MNHLSFACIFLWLCIPAASTTDLWSAIDDECSADASCALHALQQHSSKTGRSLPNAPTAVVEPGHKEYQGINLDDLGTDELQRLVHSAQNKLAIRVHLSNSRRTRQAPPDILDRNPKVDTSSVYANSSLISACGRSFYDFTVGPKSALCFCQLTNNPGCSSDACACPQGCDSENLTWSSDDTVTFKNLARAEGCAGPTTVLLTAPRSFFSTPQDLKSKCGLGAVQVIEMLLRDSWLRYQTYVAPQALNQCFHSSHIASVKFLHLQSFCADGTFHAMPNSNPGIGSCLPMHSLDDAPTLALQLHALLQ